VWKETKNKLCDRLVRQLMNSAAAFFIFLGPVAEAQQYVTDLWGWTVTVM
jgi:hypothetical protein